MLLVQGLGTEPWVLGDLAAMLARALEFGIGQVEVISATVERPSEGQLPRLRITVGSLDELCLVQEALQASGFWVSLGPEMGMRVYDVQAGGLRITVTITGDAS